MFVWDRWVMCEIGLRLNSITGKCEDIDEYSQCYHGATVNGVYQDINECLGSEWEKMADISAQISWALKDATVKTVTNFSWCKELWQPRWMWRTDLSAPTSMNQGATVHPDTGKITKPNLKGVVKKYYYCHSQTWLWLWPSNALEPTTPPPHPTQTFNCK